MRLKVYYSLIMNKTHAVKMIEDMIQELEASARDFQAIEQVLRTDGHISTAMKAMMRREQIEMLLEVVKTGGVK